MALTQCRECKKPISKAAKSCPHCGAPNKRGGVNGAVIALLALGGVTYCALHQPSPEEQAKREREDMPVTACLMAREFVTRQLKAPKSASFSNCVGDELKVSGVTGEPYRFTVLGYVDAQNSFGALIRSKFVAVVERSRSDKDSWRLVNLAM